MASMENIEKFLSRDQWEKLRYQLEPVCEKHCHQSLLCTRGISSECPIQVYVEHLRTHTRFCSGPVRKEEISSDLAKESFYRDELKKELAMPEYSRIKAKLRKISMIAENIMGTGYSVKLELTLGEIRNLMEELHEFDRMIRDIDNMIIRGYFYARLDRLTRECRSFEEDMRWAMAEKACND